MQYAKLLPGALVVVVGGIVLTESAGEGDLKVVGDIPSGLPSLKLPDFSWSEFHLLFPTSAAMSHLDDQAATCSTTDRLLLRPVDVFHWFPGVCQCR